jgi:hypothetical protein
MQRSRPLVRRSGTSAFRNTDQVAQRSVRREAVDSRPLGAIHHAAMFHVRLSVALGTAGLLGLVGALAASANVNLTKISSDPFTNMTSFHATQVEPDTFAFGSTIVSTFQSGRFRDGGASDIGFATSINGGTTWTHGFLPGTTVFSSPAGPHARATDPAVAFDAKHGVWLVNGLALDIVPSGGITGSAVFVSRSTNGGQSFDNPVNVAVATQSQDFDKNWIVCDNTASSPHFGNCYVEYDDFGHLNQLHMAVSSDGGLHWTESKVPVHAPVIGGQPLVKPNGTVIVPIDDAFERVVESFVSNDGGASYSGPFSIATIANHAEAGNLRSSPLPTAEIDGAGTVYVVWSDCRFEAGCTANDLVFSTSGDGIMWSGVKRVPIDTVGSRVDHFIPGLAVDKATSGAGAHLGLTFYFYPNTNCTTATCELDAGFISSSDGGSTWSAPVQLAGPMALNELPLTTQGFMVGDYISTSFNGNGAAHAVFAVAPVAGKTCTLGDITSCNEAMFTNAAGLSAAAAGTNGVTADPIQSTTSDHAAFGLMRRR